MMKWIDQPTQTRHGEELDAAALERYLKDGLPELTGDLVIEQFPGGFSNLTYMVRVGEREMVLRRPPFGLKIKSAHDMNREYTILSRLQGAYDKAPRPLLYTADESIIGAEFYVMERVRGVILRPSAPREMHPQPHLMRDISLSLVDGLVELHAVDLEAAGLSDFGRPKGYVGRQIHGWTRRWQKGMTDSVPAMDEAAAWLADNMPTESGASLIHNDYKYDNLILDPNDWSQIIAVLDWEMSTVGDPLMDLGMALMYWVQPDDPIIVERLGRGATMLPGNITRREFVDRYTDKSGRDIDNIHFYYAFGAFKLGVILQQIYKRWKLGHTKDTRFAGLLEAVQACGAIAVNAIEAESI